MNNAAFFDALRASRSSMFASTFTQSQVTGIEGLIDAFRTFGDGRIKTLAYALATARREVGAGMIPVREGFKKTDVSARAYVQRNYGNKGPKWYCWPVGPHGYVYYGRGYVQMTWLENYQFATHQTGLDFVGNPDLALDPKISARLLITGLISGQWNKLGHGIAYYLKNDDLDDLMGARRTVNVTDHWQEIAGHYREFLAALEVAGFENSSEPQAEPWGADDAAFEGADILGRSTIEGEVAETLGRLITATQGDEPPISEPLGLEVPYPPGTEGTAAQNGFVPRAPLDDAAPKRTGLLSLIVQIRTSLARVLAGLKPKEK